MSHRWLTRTADWPVIGQLALLTCWAHSLRWDLGDKQARVLQTTGFVVWCLQSILWFLQTGGEGRLNLTIIAGAFALSLGLMVWRRSGVRCGVFPGLSLLIAGLNGSGSSVKTLRAIPAGLLA